MVDLGIMGHINPESSGLLGPRIPYVRFGSSDRHLLLLTGGPGNDLPHGLGLTMYIAPTKKLLDRFSVWILTRRMGQPPGFSTRDMAADIADVIARDFGGRVAGVMGLSMGGLIAQYLAADHPGLAGRYVFAATAMRISPEAAGLDRAMAEHLAAGRHGPAYAAVMGYLSPPGPGRLFSKGMVRLLGPLLREPHHADFSRDVLNEALAEEAHDSSQVLCRIREPVLVIGGDSDLCFPASLQQATAAAIPGAGLVLYPGRGHGNVLRHPQFAAEIRRFLMDGEPSSTG